MHVRVVVPLMHYSYVSTNHLCFSDIASPRVCRKLAAPPQNYKMLRILWADVLHTLDCASVDTVVVYLVYKMWFCLQAHGGHDAHYADVSYTAVALCTARGHLYRLTVQFSVLAGDKTEAGICILRVTSCLAFYYFSITTINTSVPVTHHYS